MRSPLSSFIMFLTVAYLVSPIFFGGWLYYELQAGAFPPEADAIAIPFMGFMVLWFAGLVFVAAVKIGVALTKSSRDND